MQSDTQSENDLLDRELDHYAAFIDNVPKFSVVQICTNDTANGLLIRDKNKDVYHIPQKYLQEGVLARYYNEYRKQEIPIGLDKEGRLKFAQNQREALWKGIWTPIFPGRWIDTALGDLASLISKERSEKQLGADALIVKGLNVIAYHVNGQSLFEEEVEQLDENVILDEITKTLLPNGHLEVHPDNRSGIEWDDILEHLADRVEAVIKAFKERRKLGTMNTAAWSDSMAMLVEGIALMVPQERAPVQVDEWLEHFKTAFEVEEMVGVPRSAVYTLAYISMILIKRMSQSHGLARTRIEPLVLGKLSESINALGTPKALVMPAATASTSLRRRSTYQLSDDGQSTAGGSNPVKPAQAMMQQRQTSLAETTRGQVLKRRP
jgi:hypothetical protein